MAAWYRLSDADGSDASLAEDFANGPQLHWASKLSSWIHPSNRTPVRGLCLRITPSPKGRRWWWASGSMLGSLANGRLAHDQSAQRVTQGIERKVLKVKGKQLAQNSWLWSKQGCGGNWARIKKKEHCWSHAWLFQAKFCAANWRQTPFVYIFKIMLARSDFDLCQNPRMLCSQYLLDVSGTEAVSYTSTDMFKNWKTVMLIIFLIIKSNSFLCIIFTFMLIINYSVCFLNFWSTLARMIMWHFCVICFKKLEIKNSSWACLC